MKGVLGVGEKSRHIQSTGEGPLSKVASAFAYILYATTVGSSSLPVTLKGLKQ